MYLCVLCYCDACLKSSGLRVGVKTLHNKQCQLVYYYQFWYYLLPRYKFLVHAILLCESPLFGTVLNS